MGNLEKYIGPTTIDAINAQYEASNKQRSRLGLSACGHKCNRYLWYTHNGYNKKKHEGRLLRLFQLGNILEDQTILDLKMAGFKHHSCQKQVLFSHGDVELLGHIDGIVEGLIEAPKTPHLFEHKTASKKKYNELLKLGSYRKWNEGYYWQVQFYVLGLKLKRAAVFVYCKDDSRLYMERVKPDREATIRKLEDIFEAITADIEPQRACPNKSWYEAKWCDFYEVCWP